MTQSFNTLTQEGQQEFNLTFPGLETAENYESKLASGDPGAISRAVAPAVQQIDASSEATKKRIDQDSARGGAKNLALAENEINKGAQIGQASSGAYLNSFNSLAGLAQQGEGAAQGLSGAAIGAAEGAGTQYSNVASQQAAAKASQMGAVGDLVGAAGTVGGAAAGNPNK